jgi:phosphoribosyl 1,2-cyclic phosphodiesterase
MELTVVGSSSDGNGYVLQNDDEALIIECGRPFSEIKKAVGYNVSKIVGAVVSHEHGDHAKYLNQYERLYPIFSPALGKGDKKTVFGNFKIYSFPVVHDVDCYGFYIEHPDMGRLVFATDTQYVKYCFRNLRVNHIMIECNYQVGRFEVLSPKSEHVISGHMSEQAAMEFVEANRTESLRTVLFVHLSNENADWEEVTEDLKKMAQNRFKTYVAYSGLKVEL